MEQNKQQTAVEWFFMTMNIRGFLPNQEIVECYKQAKQIEKEQIIEAHKQGNKNNGWALRHEHEQYYNETYKK